MKALYFDTSVLVAAVVKTHPHHEQALPWLELAHTKSTKGYISTHVLAEFFNTLTRLPLAHNLTSDFVEMLILKTLTNPFETISLSKKDYLEAIQLVKLAGLKGPIIYDALHYQACRKKKILHLVTLNPSDFIRLANDQSITIVDPSQTRPPNPAK